MSELTPFGNRTKQRLKALKRTDAWLLKQLAEKETPIDEERYRQILTGEIHSKKQELLIGQLLTEEEHIQEMAKRIGIKRK